MLSHPLIVEAAETLFVPACVYNNTKGDADEKVLKAFDEPAWNNPVVRILGSDREDLVPRNARDWTVAGVAGAMVQALAQTDRDVPAYLALLAHESAARKAGLETAIFGMGWFWVGEAEFGLLVGVVGTRPGFFGSREVVEVLYDPRILGYEQLLETVKTEGCAQTAYPLDDEQAALARKVFGDHVTPAPGTMRPDSEPKYYLLQTPLRHVPMTGLQAVKVNAHVQKGGYDQYLSPRQQELLAAIQKHPDAGWPVAVGVEITEAWRAAETVRTRLDTGR